MFILLISIFPLGNLLWAPLIKTFVRHEHSLLAVLGLINLSLSGKLLLQPRRRVLGDEQARFPQLFLAPPHKLLLQTKFEIGAEVIFPVLPKINKQRDFRVPCLSGS